MYTRNIKFTNDKYRVCNDKYFVWQVHGVVWFTICFIVLCKYSKVLWPVCLVFTVLEYVPYCTCPVYSISECTVIIKVLFIIRVPCINYTHDVIKNVRACTCACWWRVRTFFSAATSLRFNSSFTFISSNFVHLVWIQYTTEYRHVVVRTACLNMFARFNQTPY